MIQALVGKRTVFVVIGLVLVLAATTSAIVLYTKQRQAASSSPEEAARAFVTSTLRDEYKPMEYQVSKDDSDLVRLGFGRRYAENYSVKWQSSESDFLLFIGYDKSSSDELIGYALTVYVRGKKPPSPQTAGKYLRSAPTRGWITSKPRSGDGFTSQIANVTWEDQGDKLYLSVLSLAYDEYQSEIFPGERVKDVTVITFNTYKPNNWQYGMVEQLQEADHALYGQ